MNIMKGKNLQNYLDLLLTNDIRDCLLYGPRIPQLLQKWHHAAFLKKRPWNELQFYFAATI